MGFYVYSCTYFPMGQTDLRTEDFVVRSYVTLYVRLQSVSRTNTNHTFIRLRKMTSDLSHCDVMECT